MNADKWVWLFLGIFLILYGIAAVTNLSIVWMGPITGFSALIAGFICLFYRVLK